MGADERRDLFHRCLEDVVLPQRQRLLQHRDHTRQSAHVDSDGYLGELLAAIVTGVPGRTRHGKGGDGNDLADGTEVKTSYRLDPNIDFVVEGVVVTVTSPRRQRFVSIDSVPLELLDPAIRHQINANACSVQLLAENRPDSHPLDTTLGRTVGKNALSIGASPRLALTRDAQFDDVADGTRVVACIRQERGHLNLGRKTPAQITSMFRQQPVLVFYTHDPMGRPLVTVARVGLSPTQRARWVAHTYGGSSRAKQLQPYLFPDNQRDTFYGSAKYSVAHALGGRALAVAVGTSSGVEVLHWAPEHPPPLTDLEDVLTAVVPRSECGDFSHTRVDLDLTSETGRIDAVAGFYESSVKGWYAAISPYCDAAEVTRNIGFGNLAQHLVSLRTGLLGTRSAARGADLVEPDDRVSDVKLATGDPGEVNLMKSTDTPRLNLQDKKATMLAWKRFFPVRIAETGEGLHALVHAPDQATMEDFREQVEAYFAEHPTSRNIQYHATGFPHDRYGVSGRYLTFERVAWLKPTGDHEFKAVPPA
jgi:hypothetical protein